MPGEVVDLASARAPEPERREGWGMASEGIVRAIYPTSVDDVLAAFDLAARKGLQVACWGNGRSYGDAALNDGQLLLDFSKMDRVLSWDKATGIVVAEPGVTLAKLWRTLLGDGWWPPVVSGTMFTTLGGLLAANAHGKNNLKHGPIGEHVLAFGFVSPDGAHREVTRDSDPDLFHAAIGGMGWLGVFTSVTLQMKRVHSGRLEVHAESLPDLDAMFDGFHHWQGRGMDYVVGWIDAFPGGSSLGRGQIHAARYLDAGEDPEAQASLALERQELPPTFFGVIPKRWLWRLMKPFAHRWGARLVNLGRYTWGAWSRRSHVELQTHARFNFLLDYVPDWKRIYEPGGLIQYQFFLPRERARDVFRRALERARQEGLEPWLVVMKRHRADPFWLSHALDGFSFACDFPVTEHDRGRLYRLTREFDRMVVEAGGRFYFAKDSVVDGASARASIGDAVLRRFFALKRRLDPRGLLASNQFRRVWGPVLEAIPGWPEFAGALDEPLPEHLARLAAERDPARKHAKADAPAAKEA